MGAEDSQWKSALDSRASSGGAKGAPSLSLTGGRDPKLATLADEGNSSPFLKRGFLEEEGRHLGVDGDCFQALLWFCRGKS